MNNCFIFFNDINPELLEQSSKSLESSTFSKDIEISSQLSKAERLIDILKDYYRTKNFLFLNDNISQLVHLMSETDISSLMTLTKNLLYEKIFKDKDTLIDVYYMTRNFNSENSVINFNNDSKDKNLNILCSYGQSIYNEINFYNFCISEIDKL